MMSKRVHYVLSLALIVGGVLLMVVSSLLGFAAIIGGGAARKALDAPVQAKHQSSATSWWHYLVAGYLVVCCVLALYLALSGYWQENGMPSGIQFILLGLPVLLLAAAEEWKFYRHFIASADILSKPTAGDP